MLRIYIKFDYGLLFIILFLIIVSFFYLYYFLSFSSHFLEVMFYLQQWIELHLEVLNLKLKLRSCCIPPRETCKLLFPLVITLNQRWFTAMIIIICFKSYRYLLRFSFSIILINFEVLSLHFFQPNPELETMVLSTGGNFRGPIH